MKKYSGALLFLGLGVLGVAGASSYSKSHASTLPSSNPVQAALSGKSCDLWVDPQGLPHLRADQDLTGVSCLGYLHGRDRSWQMDYFRKTAAGRKAEFYGPDAVQSDFFMRLLDIQGIAQRTFQDMPKASQDIFWAYAHGVNQGMREALKKGVYEFKQAGYEPEEWKPEDSLALVLLQSFDQTRKSFQNQLKEQSWARKFPKTAEKLFGMNSLPWDTTILKEAEYPKKAASLAGEENYSQNSPSVPSFEELAGVAQADSPKQASKELAAVEQALAQIPALYSGTGAGSNSWVVGPSKTESKKAWLANDPHLQLTHPAFWYWVHLNAKNLDTMGATLPGTPSVVSGANRHLSWGLTNSFMPVSRLSYVEESELKDSHEQRPWIWVKLWKFKVPFFFKTFRRTAGAGLPILPLPSPEGKALVLRWTGFDVKAEDFTSLYQLMGATSAREADQIFAKAQIPSWNFVFADDRGNTGYRVVGRVPRFDKLPTFGIPTEKLAEVESSLAFSKTLSPDEMPHLMNPARGYLATANNRQWPSDSRWSGGSAQAPALRAFRIEELLRKSDQHSLKSLQAIQCDNQAVDARFLVPELLRAVLQNRKATETYRGETARVDQVLGLLASWDYSAGVDCKACGVYQRWVDRLEDDLGVNTSALFQMLRSPSKFSESGLDEDKMRKLIVRNLSQAIRDMAESPSKPLPAWGAVHKTTFRHLGGRSFGDHRVLSTAGAENSVNPGTGEWNGKIYEHTAGASQRMVVEMSSPPRIYSILPGTNLDEAHPDVLATNSEWVGWKKCELRQRIFPLNWAQVLGTQASVSQVQKVVLD